MYFESESAIIESNLCIYTWLSRKHFKQGRGRKQYKKIVITVVEEVSFLLSSWEKRKREHYKEAHHQSWYHPMPRADGLACIGGGITG